MNLNRLSVLALLAMRCSFVATEPRFCARFVCPYNAVVVVMAFPPDALHIAQRYYAIIRLPKRLQLFLLYYHLFNLLSYLKDHSGSPELPIIPNVQQAMLYNPGAAI